jgi:hypothetical protein
VVASGWPACASLLESTVASGRPALLEDDAFASAPASDEEELDVDDVVADDEELLVAAAASTPDDDELIPPASSAPGLALFDVEHAANWPTTTTSDTTPGETRLMSDPLRELKARTRLQHDVGCGDDCVYGRVVFLGSRAHHGSP